MVAYNIGFEMKLELATTPVKTILKRLDRPGIIQGDMGSQYLNLINYAADHPHLFFRYLDIGAD